MCKNASLDKMAYRFRKEALAALSVHQLRLGQNWARDAVKLGSPGMIKRY